MESNKQYLDKLLTESDFSNKTPSCSTNWIMASAPLKPKLGEKVWVCGYLYPGIIEYTDGIYRGDGEFETKFDYMESVPEFKVLYYMGIERVPEESDDYYYPEDMMEDIGRLSDESGESII